MALDRLDPRPDFVLVDGKERVDPQFPQRSLVKGDRISLSIACASIIAKVTRDELMVQADLLYPGWGFAAHKGYGTQEHFQKLEALGPSPLHRMSFAPMREMATVGPSAELRAGLSNQGRTCDATQEP